MSDQKIIELSRDATLGRLTSGIVHEINNSLAVVSGHIDRMERYFQDDQNNDPRYVKSIEKQQEGIEDILQLIEGLRSFFKASSDLGMVDIHQILRERSKFLNKIFTPRGVEINLDLKANCSIVKGKASEFNQVFVDYLLAYYNQFIEKEIKGPIDIVTDCVGDYLVVNFLSDLVSLQNANVDLSLAKTLIENSGGEVKIIPRGVVLFIVI